MSSSSGNSSGAGRNSAGSEPVDTRKRKRMISNRESARRSRMRKQQHLDELLVQSTQIREQNNQIMNNLNLTTQHFVNVEAENTVLRAQMAELSHRLKSLNDIIDCLSTPAPVPVPVPAPAINNVYDHNSTFNYMTNAAGPATMYLETGDDDVFGQMMMNGSGDYDFLNPWNLMNVNQPVLATPDVFMY